MKLPAALLLSLAAATGATAAQESPQPAQPDPDYCSRRDADPKKCVIQDGPPKVLVRKPPPRSPKSNAEAAKWKTN